MVSDHVSIHYSFFVRPSTILLLPSPQLRWTENGITRRSLSSFVLHSFRQSPLRFAGFVGFLVRIACILLLLFLSTYLPIGNLSGVDSDEDANFLKRGAEKGSLLLSLWSVAQEVRQNYTEGEVGLQTVLPSIGNSASSIFILIPMHALLICSRQRKVIAACRYCASRPHRRHVEAITRHV